VRAAAPAVDRRTAGWLIATAAMYGTFCACLDSGLTNVSVHAISRSFGTRESDVAWIVLASLLALSMTLVLFGRLGDMSEQKRIMIGGFVGLAIVSLGSAFAPNASVLIALRALDGIVSAMLQASTGAIITGAVPRNELGKALGLNGAAVALGYTVGPIIGGTLVTYGNWRWVFLVNVPLAVAGIVVASIVLTRRPTLRERFDGAGAVTLGAMLLAPGLGLSRGNDWGWTSGPTLGLLLVCVPLVALFIAIERRTSEPMLDLGLFASRRFSFSVGAAVLYHMALFSLVFIIPIALQRGLGRSGTTAGIALMTMMLIVFALAPLAGTISDRNGARLLASAGAGLLGIGALALATLDDHASLGEIVGRMAIVGCGMGLFNQPNNSSIIGADPTCSLGVTATIVAGARPPGQYLVAAMAAGLYYASDTAGVTALLDHACTGVFGVALIAGFAGAAPEAGREVEGGAEEGYRGGLQRTRVRERGVGGPKAMACGGLRQRPG